MTTTFPKVTLRGYGQHEGRTQTAFLHHIEGTTVHIKVLGDRCGTTNIWLDREYSLVTGMYTDLESRGWAAFSGYKLDLSTIPESLRAQNEKKVKKAERRQRRRAVKKVVAKKKSQAIARELDGGAVRVIVKGQIHSYDTPKAARKGLRKLGFSVTDATKETEGGIQVWHIQ